MTEPSKPSMSRAARIAAATAAASVIAAGYEGLRTESYQDVAGVWTICYGDTRNVAPRQVATVEECMQRLDARMREAVEQVDACVPDLPLSVLTAFADAVYNMGPTIACNRAKSSAARLLVQRRYAEACDQLQYWDKARVNGVLQTLRGLTRRRLTEAEKCRAGL